MSDWWQKEFVPEGRKASGRPVYYFFGGAKKR